MNLEALILLIAAIVLVAVIFYVSGALVSQDWSASGSLILRILVVSLVAVFIIPAFRDAAASIDVGDLGLLVAFVLLVVVVRFILVEELAVAEEWLASIVISLIAVVLIYIVDEASRALFDLRLLEIF
jgi:hypothetical protein